MADIVEYFDFITGNRRTGSRREAIASAHMPYGADDLDARHARWLHGRRVARARALACSLKRANLQEARAQFAALNGWKFTERGFYLSKLAGGENSSCDPRFALDHIEYYKIGRRPVAVVAHNYEGRAGELREYVSSHPDLMLHVPQEGRFASWYYPNGTLPMCLTRAGLDVVWPSEQLLNITAAKFMHEERRATLRENQLRIREAALPH